MSYHRFMGYDADAQRVLVVGPTRDSPTDVAHLFCCKLGTTLGKTNLSRKVLYSPGDAVKCVYYTVTRDIDGKYLGLFVTYTDQEVMLP